MEFMDLVTKETSKCLTENGAYGLSTSNNAIVDFAFKLPAYRGMSEADIQVDFNKVLEANDPNLFKFLFYLRDPRKGLGERRLFRSILLSALNATRMSSEEIDQILALVPEFGRWDDLLSVIGSVACGDAALALIKKQLVSDLNAMDNNQPVSLLAKWLPSDNASSKQSRYLAHKIAQYLHCSMKEYRKSLVNLRKYLNVVEVAACANEWDTIDYNKVPSNANLRYTSAFIAHDMERRVQYLKDLAAGKSGVKINSAVNFPHDIVNKYRFDCDFLLSKTDDTLEELWKNLPELPGLKNTLVIRDGSASMFETIPGSSVPASAVADALTIYCADHCSGEYKNKFITFSSYPQTVIFDKEVTLRDKLKKLSKYDDCSSTDIEATFDLILNTAISNKLTQSDLPEQLLIVSDMEFDDCYTAYRISTQQELTEVTSTRLLMETISDKFEEAGYKMPKLVFWNVNSRSNTIPLAENEAGVILVSGFSLQAINMINSGERDSYAALMTVLNSDRYKDVPLAKYPE